MFRTKTAEDGQGSTITTNFHAGRKFNGDISTYLSFIRDIENISTKFSMKIGPRIGYAFYRPIAWTVEMEEERKAASNLVANFVVPINANAAAMSFAQFTYTVSKTRLELKNKEKEQTIEEEELERKIGQEVFDYLKMCTANDIHTEVTKADSMSKHPGTKTNIAIQAIRKMVMPPGSAATLQLEFVQELHHVPYANTFAELQTLMHKVHQIWTNSKETSTETNKYYTDTIQHIRNEIQTIQAIIADPQVSDNDKVRPGIDLIMFQQKLQEIQSNYNKDDCPMLADNTICLTLQSRIPATGDLHDIHNAIRKIRNSDNPKFTDLQSAINNITSEQRELATVRKNGPLRDDDSNTRSYGVLAAAQSQPTFISMGRASANAQYQDNEEAEFQEVMYQQREQRARGPPPRQAQIKYDEYPPDKDHTNCHSSCLFHLAYPKGCKRSNEACLETHYRHDIGTMPLLREQAFKVLELERLKESSKDQEPNRRRSNSLNSNGSNESNYSRNGTKRPDKRSRQDRAPTPYQQQQQPRGGSTLRRGK